MGPGREMSLDRRWAPCRAGRSGWAPAPDGRPSGTEIRDALKVATQLTLASVLNSGFVSTLLAHAKRDAGGAGGLFFFGPSAAVVATLDWRNVEPSLTKAFQEVQQVSSIRPRASRSEVVIVSAQVCLTLTHALA